MTGLPAGLALGWAVVRLWRDWPPYDAQAAARGDWLGAAPRRLGRRLRRPRGFPYRAAATLLAVTAGAVALGATQPAAGAGGGWLGWSQTLLLYALALALSTVDLRSLLVDVRLVVLGIALRVASLALFAPEQLWTMGTGLLIGAGFFHILGLFYEVLRRRQGLGEGDAAVAGLLGAFIGWQGLLPMIGLAAALGLAAAVPGLWLRRHAAQTPIPFVPFLCGAGLAVYVAQLHGWPLPWLPR